MRWRENGPSQNTFIGHLQAAPQPLYNNELRVLFCFFPFLSYLLSSERRKDIQFSLFTVVYRLYVHIARVRQGRQAGLDGGIISVLHLAMMIQFVELRHHLYAPLTLKV